MKFTALFSLLLPLTCLAADIPAQPLAQKGEQLFSDDFERNDIGEWKTVVPTFTVKDGVMRAEQTRADHGAVGRIHRPMRDVIVEFKFKLDGSTGFSAVFNDHHFKGSHAGHLCRATFTAKQLRLGDDKEGIMRNDIFEMRNDPARKAELEKLLAGRGSASAVSIEQAKWYHASIEIVGDQMRVSLDGKPVGWLKSPGIAHETKESFHFTVSGPGVVFDEVRIWKAR